MTTDIYTLKRELADYLNYNAMDQIARHAEASATAMRASVDHATNLGDREQALLAARDWQALADAIYNALAMQSTARTR